MTAHALLLLGPELLSIFKGKSRHRAALMLEQVVEVADLYKVDVLERVGLVSEVLLQSPEPDLAEQIDALYEEVASLAALDAPEIQGRLRELQDLQAQEAERYAADFDAWRPLPRGALDEQLAAARRLLGK